MTAPPRLPGSRAVRLPALDAARGLALVAMFAYHLTWDFAHFGFIDAATPYSAGMRVFSHAIASSFLFVAGAALVLASRPFRARAFWKRFATIAGAATLVTFASYFFSPDAIIFFGILHCIAAASVLALPFLFLPWPAAALAALVAAGLPQVVAASAFDPPALAWLGLNAHEPRSLDFRPLLPWAAPLLAGVAVFRSPLAPRIETALARRPMTGAPARALRFLGRHSLAVYLVHQPAFIALIAGYVALAGAPRAADEAPFLAACETRCVEDGRTRAACARACGCIAGDMKRLNLWPKLLADTLDEAERALLSRVAGACAAK